MNKSHRNANVLTARFFVLLVAAAGRVDAADRQPGHIADNDFVMPNIHFGYQIRQGKFAKVPYQPNLDVTAHHHWNTATQALVKNEQEIYEDLPRFVRSASKCPYPVVGRAIDMTEEFWALGESIKVNAVDVNKESGAAGRTQLGRVKTSFWNWGSHWMRVEREWRDPSGEQVFASSSSAAGSWYHNTVLVEDCEGETLAYIKFKLGAVEQIGAEKNNDPTYTVITVHDLVGNEVAVAYMPRGDPDAADWRHRRIVVHDRSSGMKMVEIDGLNDGEGWRISFKEGSEVLGGLGSDPRVMVMLVAWHDAAAQFGIASVPLWPLVIFLLLLLLACVWCWLPADWHYWHNRSWSSPNRREREYREVSQLPSKTSVTSDSADTPPYLAPPPGVSNRSPGWPMTSNLSNLRSDSSGAVLPPGHFDNARSIREQEERVSKLRFSGMLRGSKKYKTEEVEEGMSDYESVPPPSIVLQHSLSSSSATGEGAKWRRSAVAAAAEQELKASRDFTEPSQRLSQGSEKRLTFKNTYLQGSKTATGERT